VWGGGLGGGGGGGGWGVGWGGLDSDHAWRRVFPHIFLCMSLGSIFQFLAKRPIPPPVRIIVPRFVQRLGFLDLMIVP